MTITREHLLAAVDAAMMELQNISPPMRRSECERLIKAAMSAQAKAAPVAEPTIKESLTVAEPVAWAAFAENGNIRMWCRSALGVADMSDDHGNKAVPLYTAPPHDAERVELLREASASMAEAHDSMFAQCCSNGITNAWGKPVNVTKLNDLQLVVRRIDTYLATLPRT